MPNTQVRNEIELTTFDGDEVFYAVDDPSGTPADRKIRLDKVRTGINQGRVALTDATSIATNGALGNLFSVTLGGNRTLANPTNLKDGATYMWIIKQDATGNRTLAYGTTFAWPGGTTPALSTAANAIDVISAVYDGTKLYAACNKNFV